MVSFPEVLVGNLLEEKNGIAVGVMYPGEHTPNGVPLVRVGDISRAGYISEPSLKVSPEVHHEYRRTELKGGECIITLVGKPGQVIVIPEEMAGWNVARALAVLRLKDRKDGRYLTYALASPKTQNTIKNWCNTTVQPTLNLKEIRALPIPWPEPEIRSGIVAILASLDEKIELNRRMNETLEAMSQAIFKDWFVDFGPVRRKIDGETDPTAILGGLLPHPEKAAPIADLFPDTFGDNGVPEGWTEGTLGDYAFNAGTMVSPSDVSDDTPYIGLEHMPRSSIALSEWETSAKVTSNKSKFVEGQILYGKLRPYFHKVGVAVVSGICSTDIVVIDGKTAEHRPFVAACVSSSEFVDYTDKTSTGTKMPRTSWNLMKQYPVPLVPHPITSEFGELVAPLFARLNSAIQEIRNLAQTRDLLLPKLMSGEIRLADADVITSELFA